MTTKISKLTYEYDNITTQQIIDIDASTLGMDDGNNISTTNSSFYIEAIILSTNATNTGAQIRRGGYSYKSSTLAVEIPGPSFGSDLGGNAFVLFGASGGNIRVFVDVTVATSTNVRLFLEIRGYND